MPVKLPLVIVRRRLWRDLSLQAATASRECGGVILGKRTQRAIHCIHAVPLAHKWATRDQVDYDWDEKARARLIAYGEYGPELEPVGEWHPHLYDSYCKEVVLPQISSGKDGDIDEMLVGDVELIAIVFPAPKLKTIDIKARTDVLHADVGDYALRLEAWLKVKNVNEHEEKADGEDDRVIACRMSLR